MQQQYAELAAQAKELNNESDNINDIITQTNKQLAELNIGLEVWVGPWGNKAYQAGYARLDSGWGLATRDVFKSSKDDDDEDDGQKTEYSEAVSLLSAPRSIRIDALDDLERIIEALKTKAKNSIDTIHEAKKIVAELTAAA
jgi:uncharacterized coiled-coil DUF342 family protein